MEGGERVSWCSSVVEWVLGMSDVLGFIATNQKLTKGKKFPDFIRLCFEPELRFSMCGLHLLWDSSSLSQGSLKNHLCIRHFHYSS